MARELRAVVVIGGGVAGLAAAWALSKREQSVLLLERSAIFGGLVESEHPMPGVTLEHGADGLLADKPGGLDVLRELGLDGDLVRGGRAPKRAFVSSNDELVPLPGGLFAFERRALATMLASPLLSPAAKLRLALEPTVRRGEDVDESVASFFTRRLGPEVEAKLVRPMVRGIFGAETDALGVRSVFPKLAEMERRYGSVGLALLIAPRKVGTTGLVTLEGGMASLPRALADQARARGATLRTGTGVRSIERRGPRLRLSLDEGADVDADALVLAADLSSVVRLLATLAPEASQALGQIHATDADVVGFVHRRADVLRPLDGSGFVASDTGRRTLACTWASEKWAGRAPDDLVVLRSVLRSDRAATDAEVARVAHDELRGVMALGASPLHTSVRRRRNALPVYGVGHAARIDAVREMVTASGGVALAGNYLQGVGVPDAISSGLRAARELLAM